MIEKKIVKRISWHNGERERNRDSESEREKERESLREGFDVKS